MDDPVLLYSEINQERWETRKVDIFEDGAMERADAGSSLQARVALGEAAIPSFEEIAANPEFELEEINKEDFEIVWSQATYGKAD